MAIPMADDLAATHKLNAWLSPAYPVGGFAYSHGLEFAISNGDVRDAATFADWVADVLLLGSGRNDAILLCHAYRAATDGALQDIADLACALAPSRERLLETTAQGQAFSRTTRAVWPPELPDLPYPVAIGSAAHLHGIDLSLTLNLYLHSFMSNIIQAGVRFIPLGQTDGQRILAAQFPAITELAEQAVTLSLDDLGSSAFRADMASMQHETMATRIFRS